MTAFTRRSLIKGATAALLGSVAPIKAGSAKSKRHLMMEVLNMEAKPGYVPAGFFMHFGVHGDAAIVDQKTPRENLRMAIKTAHEYRT